MAAPAVSVLMGVRDGAAWISRAITSVLAQTLTDLELVVVDDCSTDATAALLSGVHDPRLVVERQDRAGLTVALNRALARARAPLVARLDADDVAKLRALIAAPRSQAAPAGHVRSATGR